MIRAALLAAATLVACLSVPTASAHSRHAQCLTCTPEQRDAFRTSEELVRRLWLQSRRAQQSVRKEGATSDRVESHLRALSESFQDAWRAHETFLGTLDEAHAEVLSTRLNRIEALRTHAKDNFEDLEEILESRPPDQVQANWRFGRIVRSMRNWVQQNERIEWHANW